ncbi:hypothetical protein FACS189454_04910 [Planctomycetales bacterium]|nr:hypothetical protein FACS189454_04910 [Planctomycetales bacterium]
MNFEQSVAQLEEILKRLGDDNVDLETALQQYEEGVGLLKNCYAVLQNAQRKVELLQGFNPDGTALTESIPQ